jgi:hypothetical protein
VRARGSEDARRTEIDAFNKRYVELHLKMDTYGILALWAEDGVDLMPGDSPLLGRKKITAWVEDILAKMPGYKGTNDIRLRGLGLRVGHRTSSCAAH